MLFRYFCILLQNPQHILRRDLCSAYQEGKQNQQRVQIWLVGLF